MWGETNIFAPPPLLRQLVQPEILSLCDPLYPRVKGGPWESGLQAANAPWVEEGNIFAPSALAKHLNTYGN